MGLDVSAAAIESAQARARAAGMQPRLRFFRADLDLPLPFDGPPFDAAMSLDVVLHLHDRQSLFERVVRVLRPHGRLLVTDAGVISGPVSSQELQRRSSHGFTQFVPPGVNETMLATAGLRLVGTEDRTASVSRHARGRLRALGLHRDALEQALGKSAIDAQQAYLETVAELAERKALSRVMYLAQAG